MIGFLIVFIKQVLFLVTFGFAVSINSDGIIFVPVTLLIIYLVFYFKCFKNLYIQMSLDKKLFNLYYFISWIIIGLLLTYLILTESWLWNMLPTTKGMFSGLEYILIPILLIIYLVVWVILKIGIYIKVEFGKCSMKSKWNLISSIIQLIIGISSIVTFVVLGLNGENMIKWIVTLILSIGFVILGIVGIIDYKR